MGRSSIRHNHWGRRPDHDPRLSVLRADAQPSSGLTTPWPMGRSSDRRGHVIAADSLHSGRDGGRCEPVGSRHVAPCAWRARCPGRRPADAGRPSRPWGSAARSVRNKRVLAINLDPHAAGRRSEPKQFARQWAAGADRARRFGLHDLRKRRRKDHDHPFAGFGIDIRSPHAIATAISDAPSSAQKRTPTGSPARAGGIRIWILLMVRRGARLAARKNGLGLNLTH